MLAIDHLYLEMCSIYEINHICTADVYESKE